MTETSALDFLTLEFVENNNPCGVRAVQLAKY